ncbi:MAG: hypothetical protein K2X11_02340, partial [Acetobacteraceae bacterium]|nr:hypothetical protein [Acetobacteraceae bacterium]
PPAGRDGCAGQVLLRNAAPLAVEQVFAGGPVDWGTELLGQGTVPPGGQVALRVPVPPPGLRSGFRVVFVNGRAAELPGVDVCATPNIAVLPDGMRATPP